MLQAIDVRGIITPIFADNYSNLDYEIYFASDNYNKFCFFLLAGL